MSRGRAVLPWLALLTLAACDDEPPAAVTLVADAAPIPDGRPGDAAPDMPPVARVWFVAADTAAVGDGSREAPFAEPAAAYAIARSGDLVVLLPGQYPTPPLPPAGVELVGSGAAVTTVGGPWVIDRPVTLGAMTVRGGDPPLHITATGRAEVHELRIDEAVTVGIRVEGGFGGRDITAAGAPALLIEPTGDADVRGGSLEGTGDAAVVSRGRLRLDTVGLSGEAQGLLVEGGEAVVETALIDGVTVGVQVLGGQVIVRGGLVRNARDPRGTGTAVRVLGGHARIEDLTVQLSDRGLRVDPQGALEVQRGVVSSPATDGLSVQGGTATASNMLVVSPGNVGFAVLDEGRLELIDGRVDDAARVGVLVNRATLIATDLVVRSARVRGIALTQAIAELTRPVVIEAGNVGLQITDPIGRIAVQDAVVDGCGTSGISVFGTGGEVVFEGVQIDGTRPGEAGLAHGIHLFQAQAELRDVVSANNAGAGLLVEQSTGVLDGGILSFNGEPGLLVLEPSAPFVAANLQLQSNRGAGALTLAGELRLTDCVASRSVFAVGLGAGHGFQVGVGGRLEVQGGQSLANAGSGIAFDAATTGTVAGVELLQNEGHGLLVACGALVDEPEPSTYAGNVLGDRAVCDR